MPVDLLNRAEALAERAETAAQSTQHEQVAARYSEAASRVQAVTQAVRTLDDIVGAYTDSEILEESLEPEAEEVRALAASVDAIEDGPDEAPLFARALSDLATEVIAFTARADGSLRGVREHWLTQQPSPPDAFFQVLRSIAPPEAEETARARSTFETLSEASPNDPADIERLAEAARELRTAYDVLITRADLTAPVRTFLDQAPRGVRLDELEGEVLEWLRSSGAADSFVVRLAP